MNIKGKRHNHLKSSDLIIPGFDLFLFNFDLLLLNLDLVGLDFLWFETCPRLMPDIAAIPADTIVVG